MTDQISRMRDKTYWETKNPILRSGEPGFEGETGKLKIGDGVTRWNDLPYEDVAPFTLPKETVSFGSTPESLKEVFVTVIDAGVNLETARPANAKVVLWRFNAGVNVGVNGANVTNRLPGDLIFVAA